MRLSIGERGLNVGLYAGHPKFDPPAHGDNRADKRSGWTDEQDSPIERHRKLCAHSPAADSNSVQ